MTTSQFDAHFPLASAHLADAIANPSAARFSRALDHAHLAHWGASTQTEFDLVASLFATIKNERQAALQIPA